MRLCVFLILVACGSSRSEPDYPRTPCEGPKATTEPGFCNGRAIQLTTLLRESDGNAFDFTEVDSANARRVMCPGCPFLVGNTYRARLTKPDKLGNEDVYGILVDGSEVKVKSAGIFRCTEPAPWRWEAKGDQLVCKSAKAPACLASWPEGVGNKIGKGGTAPIKVNLQFDASAKLKNADLAKELSPDAFFDQLNTLGAPRDHKFVVADALPLLYVTIAFTSDGDKVGMTVSVTGPENLDALHHGGKSVPWFTYTVPPIYTTSAALLAAGALPFVEMTYQPGGWTCDATGTPHARDTLAHYCDANHVECTLPPP
jgi:hypothetical protein